MFCFFKEKCCIFRAINSPSKGECLTLEVKSAVKSRLCYLGLYFKSSGRLDQTEKWMGSQAHEVLLEKSSYIHILRQI